MRIRTSGRRAFAAGPSLVDLLTGAVSAASGGSLLRGLASVYDTVEIRTSITPPANLDLYGLANDSGPPSPLTQFLKPTIVFSGAAGREVIAPYGEAEGGWMPALTAFGAVVGVGFALGWWARGRRSRS